MSRSLVVWINDAAGSGKATRWGERALTTFDTLGLQTFVVDRPDAASAAQDARTFIGEGAEALVCIGGDGTVHHGLQVAAATGVPMGIVPSGSGDDIARAAGMVQSDPTRCIAQIVRALDMAGEDLPTMDLGRATTTEGSRWFGATLYAGFDARVNERANAMRFPPGRSRYPVAMLAELATFEPLPFDITIEGQESWSQPACVAVVANGPSYGGGMQVVPHARTDDAMLDLMLLGQVSKAELLRVFPRVYRGTHGLHPAVRFHRGTRVTLDAPDLHAWADGEHVGPLPVTVEVDASALTILRPA